MLAKVYGTYVRARVAGELDEPRDLVQAQLPRKRKLRSGPAVLRALLQVARPGLGSYTTRGGRVPCAGAGLVDEPDGVAEFLAKVGMRNAYEACVAALAREKPLAEAGDGSGAEGVGRARDAGRRG